MSVYVHVASPALLPSPYPVNTLLTREFPLPRWYSRYDIQKRYAFFYLIGILASGTSGILAYGLMQMVRLLKLTVRNDMLTCSRTVLRASEGTKHL